MGKRESASPVKSEVTRVQRDRSAKNNRVIQESSDESMKDEEEKDVKSTQKTQKSMKTRKTSSASADSLAGQLNAFYELEKEKGPTKKEVKIKNQIERQLNMELSQTSNRNPGGKKFPSESDKFSECGNFR